MSNPGYLSTLTPLRGIAALLVVVFHSNLMLKAFMPPGYTRLVSMGWLWVDFFFVLSGFIMSYVYGKNFKDGISSGMYWKYIGARFARIYPLHLFTLILAFIAAMYIRQLSSSLDPFFDSMFTPYALPTSLLLLQGMHVHMTAPLNTPSWSLSTEWWMYMLFPFLVPYFTNLKGLTKLIIFLLIAAGYIAIMYLLGPLAQPFPGGPPTLDVVADFGFLRCAVGFVAGVLLFEFYSERKAFTLFKNDWMFILLFVMILAGMHFGINELFIVLLFPLTLLAAAYNCGNVKRILDTRPLQRLGDWSFSIYMVHVPIIYLFWIDETRNNPAYFSDFMKLVTTPPDYSRGLVYLPILLTATIVMAALTYTFIEIPARNYLNNRFKSKTRVVNPETVA